MGRLQVVFTILSVLASLSLADISSSRVVRPEPTKGSSREESTSRAAVPWGYGKAPLGFEANRGQSDAAVDFIARGPGYALFLTANGAVLSLRKGAPAGVRRTPLGLPGEEAATAIALRLRFIGGRDATGTGRSELSGRANYFAGNDPARWRTNIPTYAKVVYEDVYPGIDLAYYGAQGQLEYDFILKPGADPAQIALRYEGAEGVEVREGGDLVVTVGTQEIRQGRARAYQEIDGVRQAVGATYRLSEHGEVRLEIGAYDSTAPLVIDPVLAYSTYLGGTGFDGAEGIAVDALGSAYVAGKTLSLDFPTTVGAFQTTTSAEDVFVSKLNPAGTALVYSTYLGGNQTDIAEAIAIDAFGSAYMTGTTASLNFPTTTGALQPTPVGTGYHAFVTKLSPTGSDLAYSTYMGANGGGEVGYGIAVDSGGAAFITGYTNSTFPTTLGAFQSSFGGGEQDAFVAKLNALGSAFLYSTQLGGTGNDVGQGIRVDATGSAYVTGNTSSANFPVTGGAFQTTLGGGPTPGDAFVTKLNALGTGLLYSTYLGGNGDETGFDIAVDGAGNAYVTGSTFSTNFPTTAGSFQPAIAGGIDVFVTKLNALGNALTYSTYLGGEGTEFGYGIAIDTSGSAYVTGSTESTSFPVLDAFQPAFGGNIDAFVTKVDPTGSALLYSTYLGGINTDEAHGIAVDGSAESYVAGFTSTADFPTTLGAFQPTTGGGFDAFVAKIGVLPNTQLCDVLLTEGGWITAKNGDMATYHGHVTSDGLGNVSGNEGYMDHGPTQPFTMDSTAILSVTCNDTRTTATIIGQGTIDGTGNHTFRIDMVDGGLGGSSDRYGISLDNGYSSGLQLLGGGNVTIH